MPADPAAAAAVEALLAHGHDDPKAAEQSKNDRLDDPGHNKPDAKVDPKWHETSDGYWSAPDEV